METLEPKVLLSAMNLELLSQWGGTPYGVAVSGNYAYLCRGATLDIVNVATPANMTSTGALTLPGIARDVVLSGNLAYVADSDAGLVIVDISDPAAPVLRGKLDTSGRANGVFVSGNLAYVADGLSGLQIIDITNPSAPVLSGTYNTPYYADDVFVSGNLAYVADEHSLQIIDVSIPAAPALSGTFATNAFGVYVAGGLAYVAAGHQGLQILDVSNPAAPTVLGSCTSYGATNDYALSVSVSGNVAYLGDEEIGAVRIDVTDPAAPTLVDFTFNGGSRVGYSYSIVAYQDRLYVASGIPGFQVYALGSSSLDDSLSGTYPSGSYAHYVSLLGNYAYVGGYSLRVLDTTDAARPLVVGSPSSYPGNMFISGNLGYVVDGWSYSMDIMDLTSPAAPIHKSSCTTFGYRHEAVAVSGNTAYLAGDGLGLIDVTSAQSPQYLTEYNIPSHAYGLCISGSYLYLADGAVGLRIYDISSPRTPTLRATIDTPGSAHDVYVRGNFAYVADYDHGLEIIDVSNPLAPVIRGTCDTTGYAQEVFVSGNLAYVADGPSGLQVINIYHPEAPVLRANYNPGGSGENDGDDVCVANGRVYFANDDGGLFIFREPDEPDPSIAISNATILENQASGTTVGSFSTVDPAGGAPFAFTLVNGTGSTDNALFSITNGVLKTAATFDYETRSTYSIRVRSTDHYGLVLENVFTITIGDTNDAPKFTGGSWLVGTVGQTVTSQLGTAVSSLISSGITDQDAGALKGMAITAADTTQGTWQFSLDGGATWSALGSVTGSSARLLPADNLSRVRFCPNGSYLGTLGFALTYRAWDRTTGVSGGTASTSPSGGTTAFSTTSGWASLTVRIDGDSDGDGAVGGSDYTAWLNNFGTTSGANWYKADFDGDGVVGGSDYGIWLNHFGIGADNLAVPAPAGTTALAPAAASAGDAEVMSQAAVSSPATSLTRIDGGVVRPTDVPQPPPANLTSLDVQVDLPSPTRLTAVAMLSQIGTQQWDRPIVISLSDALGLPINATMN